MPLYFTHLVDGEDELLDPEGVERSAESVAGATLLQARDCMAGDVKRGTLDLGYRLEVRDADGVLVHCLAFPDAIEILRQHLPGPGNLAA